MLHSATSMAIPFLLSVTLALASSSNSYGPTYTISATPTLTAAILGSPFVNPPGLTVEDTQTPCSTESPSALTISTNSATIETWTSTQTLESMKATNMVQAISSITTDYTGFEAPTATTSNGECGQTVACADGVKVRALRPTPVMDSGSMPLRGRLSWTWWDYRGVLPMSTCMLAML
jgi:hypothetical protein